MDVQRTGDIRPAAESARERRARLKAELDEIDELRHRTLQSKSAWDAPPPSFEQLREEIEDISQSIRMLSSTLSSMERRMFRGIGTVLPSPCPEWCALYKRQWLEDAFGVIDLFYKGIYLAKWGELRLFIDSCTGKYVPIPGDLDGRKVCMECGDVQ